MAVLGDAHQGVLSTTRDLVSVIIPVHNGQDFLAEAVASVRQQVYPDVEIIIVDDGSSDGTASLIMSLGRDIVTARQPQRGPAAARNRGLSLAHGEFIAFLDADDMWPPGKLQSQLDRLRDDPLLDVVLGHVQPIYSADVAAADAHAIPQPVMTVQLGSAVFRRQVFATVGLFDDGLFFSEDHDWFLRAREQHVHLAVMAQVTLLYRRHPGNMTRARDHQGYQLTKILKASLDRRRSDGASRTRSLPKLADYADMRPAPLAEQREHP